MASSSRTPFSSSASGDNAASVTGMTTSWTPPPPLATNNSDPSSPVPTTSGSSAALYLYTFLATLILLLGVSSAIVIRSLILRRRHRFMVEEAIRNGTWIQPTSSNRRVDLSKKPKMFEAFIADEDPGRDGKAKGTAMINAYVDWASMTPISVVGIDTRSPTPSPPVVPQPAPPPPLFAWLRPTRFLRRQAPIPPEQLVMIPAAPTTTPLPDQVHVAVLVAMPSPQPLTGSSNRDEEQELPPLQMGLVTVPVIRTDDLDSDERGKTSSDDMV